MAISRKCWGRARSRLRWSALMLGALIIFACETVPITGRSQLMLLSGPEEVQLGLTAYREILSQEKLSRNRRVNALVQRVGERIAAVSNRPDYQWEFRVIDKDQANAFALPGGKVAVYTGILKYTKTEAGLAVVMGHEVAHALARHGAERMSQSMLANTGLSAISAIAGAENQALVQAIGVAYGVGVQLPFGRGQESEADRIGLILMAQAGYDPREAIPFWQRMSAAKGGGGPPEFLSTHPSGETRIRQLQQWMPEALAEYRPRK
ncbi:peptidase M48 family protein [Candidatus Entotheonella serta]|nr:peptidase M48 family protein [Candidatus Entotheonella serta]